MLGALWGEEREGFQFVEPPVNFQLHWRRPKKLFPLLVIRVHTQGNTPALQSNGNTYTQIITADLKLKFPKF